MPTTSSTKSTSSPHDAPSARLNEGSVAKEVRAHEHARHRTKERREHALAKERKEKAAAERVLGLKGAHAHGTKPVRRASMEDWGGEEPAATGARSAAQSPARRDVAPATPAQAAEKNANSAVASTMLTLGDVLSRPRRPKAKHLDFELVPPIRAVIALDDVDADDAEPWEYITRASVNDGSAWKNKSFAQAVASAM